MTMMEEAPAVVLPMDRLLRRVRIAVIYRSITYQNPSQIQT